jgi:hypothetical protein
VATIDASDLGASLAISLETALSAQFLVGVKEACGVWEIEYHPPAEDADEDGDETLDDDCGC